MLLYEVCNPRSLKMAISNRRSQQVLYEIMQDIIEGWHLTDSKEEATWRDAANQFRLPYWDWARRQEYAQNFAIPQVCTLDVIDIIMPGGKTTTIPNPLVEFRNPKVDSKGNHVTMGDPSMGPNAIKDDTDGTEPLPVSAPYRCQVKAEIFSGASA
jgi:hypothetical protein